MGESDTTRLVLLGAIVFLVAFAALAGGYFIYTWLRQGGSTTNVPIAAPAVPQTLDQSQQELRQAMGTTSGPATQTQLEQSQSELNAALRAGGTAGATSSSGTGAPPPATDAQLKASQQMLEAALHPQGK